MTLDNALPFLKAARGYSAGDFRADLAAALTLAPMAMPQAMAYALIAGVHPQYGIYSCIFPVIVAALMGSSRFLVGGPTNSMSMVLYSSLGTVAVGGVWARDLPADVLMPLIFLIALLCGLIQIGMGLARLGELTNFISHSVMTAFVNGASLLIAAGQLPTILGLDLARSSGLFPQMAQVLANLGHTNPWSVLTTAATIALILLLKRVSRRFPATLAALVLVGAMAAVLDAEDHGVRMVSALEGGLPPLSVPTTLDLSLWRELFLPALAVAVLGTVQSLTIAKQMSSIRQDPFDASKEMIGQGLGNVAAGLTSALPGCGSLTLSALMFASGGRTRFCAVMTGLLALPMLLVLAPLVSWLPMPALSGVLLLACASMISPDSLRLSFEATRVDRVVLVATLASTLLLDLVTAILVGVVTSLVLFIYATSRPHVRRVRKNSPIFHASANLPRGLVVYAVEGALYFGAIHELERRLAKLEKSSVRLVVLHINRVIFIDASGAHALTLFLERCHARSVPVVLVVSNHEVRETLRRSGMLSCLGDGFVAHRIEDGLRMGTALLNRMSCRPEDEGQAESQGPAGGLPRGDTNLTPDRP